MSSRYRRCAKRPSPPGRRCKIERLEDRTLLNAYTWTPTNGNSWNTAANWNPNAQGTLGPGVNDDVTFKQGGNESVAVRADQANSVLVAEGGGSVSMMAGGVGFFSVATSITVSSGTLKVDSKNTNPFSFPPVAAQICSPTVTIDSSPGKTAMLVVGSAQPANPGDTTDLDATNGVIVGNNGTGTLEIGSRGSVDAGITIGRLKGSAGTVAVDPGTGVLPPNPFGLATTNATGIVVGSEGTGTLTISAPAPGGASRFATCKYLTIGAGKGGKGTVTVGDRLEDQTLLTTATADQSSAQLTVTSALAVDQSAAFGSGPNSTSTTTVSGPGGSLVSTLGATIGAGTGSQSSVTLNGSQWAMGPQNGDRSQFGALTIGQAGATAGSARLYFAPASGATAALHSRSVTVNEDGYVEGTGTVDADMPNVAGTILPGNTRGANGNDVQQVGTLSVTGNVSFAPSGRLVVDIAGDNPSSNDLLAVAGNLNPAGGILALNEMPNFQAKAGDSFTVVTYQGALSSQFIIDASAAPLPAGDQWVPDYTVPNKVIVDVVAQANIVPKSFKATGDNTLDLQYAIVPAYGSSYPVTVPSFEIDVGASNTGALGSANTAAIFYSCTVSGADLTATSSSDLKDIQIPVSSSTLATDLAAF
ncbi:MAG: hypothetical protein ABSG86_26945, partial [Thermoguttaceae bacterium]